MTTQTGVVVNSGGTIESVVYGYTGSGATSAIVSSGQSFQALSDVTALSAGQATPVQATLTLSSTDYQMSRGLEDLVAALLNKGVIAKTDLPAGLITKIDARRALRGQSAL